MTALRDKAMVRQVASIAARVERMEAAMSERDDELKELRRQFVRLAEAIDPDDPPSPGETPREVVDRLLRVISDMHERAEENGHD